MTKCSVRSLQPEYNTYSSRAAHGEREEQKRVFHHAVTRRRATDTQTDTDTAPNVARSTLNLFFNLCFILFYYPFYFLGSSCDAFPLSFWVCV